MKSKIQNCWHFMKCSEKKKMNCDTFKLDLGKEGWHVPKEFEEKNSSTVTCISCPWYMKNNPEVANYFLRKPEPW